MALTDIAGGDLEEMLREEAEDVFYDDGRLQAAELEDQSAGRLGGGGGCKCEAHRWRR